MSPGAVAARPERRDSHPRLQNTRALDSLTACAVSFIPSPHAFSTDASSCAMTSMPSIYLSVFCPMITTSPPPGSTTNGLVNRTGPHGVLIVKWSGHDYISIPIPGSTTPPHAHIQQTPVVTRFASHPAVPAGPLPAPPTLLQCLTQNPRTR